MPAFLDFELRSRIAIGVRGSDVYVNDPSTSELCMASLILSADGQRAEAVEVWTPFDLAVRPLTVEWPGRTQLPGMENIPVYVNSGQGSRPAHTIAAARGSWLAGHNATAIERPVWDGLGYAHPNVWVDTLPLTRRAGFVHAGLDAVGEFLYGRGKSAFQKSAQLLWQPDKNGQFVEPTTDTMSATIQYCLDDVLLNAAIWFDEIQPMLPAYPAWEHALLAIDADINARGLGIDVELAKAALHASRLVRAREAGHVKALGLTPAMLRSEPQMLAWLRQRGVLLPDLRADRLAALLKHPHTSRDVVQAVWARMGAMRKGAVKCEAALRTVGPGHRVRHTLAYYAAHTGRWGGRGMQPHNLPRPEGKLKPEVLVEAVLTEGADVQAVVLQACQESGCTPDDVAAALVRPVLIAGPGMVLAQADYSAIEGRGVAWASGDEADLDVYRSGTDPYCVMASVLYNRPYEEIKADKSAGRMPGVLQRQVGKVGVLQAGYQSGGERLSLSAANMGIDLSEAGVTGQQIVEAWRDAHPLTAGVKIGKQIEETGTEIRRGGLWKALHYGVREVVESRRQEPVEIGKCLWHMRGDALVCRLPSGRPLFYRKASIEMVVPRWGGEARPTVTYGLQRRTYLYGGKLCIAEGTPVATKRGWVAIECVRPGDLVWDGLEWVRCDGAVYNGMRDVIQCRGVRLTGDHQILTEHAGWQRADAIADSPSWSSPANLLASGLSLLKSTRSAACAPMVRGPQRDECECSVHAAKSPFAFLRLCAKVLRRGVRAAVARGVGVRTCAPTEPCSTNCAMSSAGPSVDATTRNHWCGTTTVDVGYTSTQSGVKIGAHSWPTSWVCRTASWISRWIASITIAGMNRGTYGSARKRNSAPIGERPYMRSSAGPSSADGRCLKKSHLDEGGGTSRRSACAVQCATCDSTPLRPAHPAAAVDTVRVYDVLNAGPRHQYVVFGDEPLIVENCENVVQAVCRDIMAHALMRLAAEGFMIVLHVHDEIVSEVPEAQAEALCERMVQVMADPPGWAKGFPIAVEGFAHKRYLKEAPKGWPTFKAKGEI